MRRGILTFFLIYIEGASVALGDFRGGFGVGATEAYKTKCKDHPSRGPASSSVGVSTEPRVCLSTKHGNA
jgi:hypothetical protein